MRNKILKIIQTSGPLLPVEISSKVGENSFLISACLEELVESKQILSSKEKVGTSRLFYTKEQEGKVSERINVLLKPTKTASTFKKGPAKETPDLAKKRNDFAKRLKKIEDDEAKFKSNLKTTLKSVPEIEGERRAYYSVPKEKNVENRKFLPKDRTPENIPKIPPKNTHRITPKLTQKITSKINPVSSKVLPDIPKPTIPKNYIKQKKQQFVPQPIRKHIPQPQSQPTSKFSEDSFEMVALNYLREKNIQILTELTAVSSKESEVMVSVPSGVGPVKFVVRIKTKKKINRSDLMELYATALEKRTSAILLTNGKLASTAKIYLKDVGGLLRVKLF